jgi:hypothetical protein
MRLIALLVTLVALPALGQTPPRGRVCDQYGSCATITGNKLDVNATATAGPISTAAKGSTAAGSPTSTNVDANTQALDVYVRGGTAGGGGVADLQVRSAGGTWTDVGTAGGNLNVPVDVKTMPTTPVTGTFWQSIQPVSWSGQSVSVSALPGSPAQEHTAAASPNACQLSNGASFYAAPSSGQLPAALDGSGYLKTHEQGTANAKISKAAGSPASTAVSCGVTATAIPASPLASRTSLCVYNNGAAAAYIGPGSVTTASGFPIPAGGYWCDDVGSQAYSCIVGSGTVEVRALEN